MKTEIRKLNKEQRRNMDKYEVEHKSQLAAEYFVASDIYKNSAVIMLYMPLGNETDTSAIINQAFRDGKRVVFPVTDLNSGDITPYYANNNTEFAEGAFSVREPINADIAPAEEIDTVIVPGIAFDRKGARIGFGKGCYDRFLRQFSAVKVGFCYEFQLCDKIYADAHDINMDFLVTENGLTDCGQKN